MESKISFLRLLWFQPSSILVYRELKIEYLIKFTKVGVKYIKNRFSESGISFSRLFWSEPPLVRVTFQEKILFWTTPGYIVLFPHPTHTHTKMKKIEKP